MEPLLPWWTWLVAVILLAVGFGLGLLSRRWLLRVSSSCRAGMPELEPAIEGLPRLGDARQLWVLPDLEQRRSLTVRLAGHVGKHRPVLLVCSERERDAVAPSLHAPAIAWLSEERPSVEDVLLAARPLAWMGRPLVVVYGAAALEEVAEDEEADEVVAELLQDCPHDLDLLVLELEGQPLRRQPDHRVGEPG